MDNQNLIGKWLYNLTAPTPQVYKLARAIWSYLTIAAGEVLLEAKAGITLSEHLILAAKIVGGIAAAGVMHAQSQSTNTKTPDDGSPQQTS
jgi:uncharacterized membrane protein